MTSKSPRGIKSALTKLNNQINQLANKRDSIVALIHKSEREARYLNEHITSLNKMLGDVDFQMPRLLEQHEHRKTDYLQSICK